MWSDGSTPDFTAWGSRDEEVDCVRLKKTDAGYEWHDRSCWMSYAFICEYEMGSDKGIVCSEKNSKRYPNLKHFLV